MADAAAFSSLTAERRDGTGRYAGIGILEDISDLASSFESGSWVDEAIGGIGTSLDALGFCVDPVGTVVSWGVAWLMEHLRPLSVALDYLAGDPDQIAAYAETWRRIAVHSVDQATALRDAARTDLVSWTGSTAGAYGDRAAEQEQALTAIAKAAETTGNIVAGVGMLIAFVRELVRDLIADLVSILAVRLWEWIAEAGITLGLATPWVVAQVSSLVAKWASEIARLLRALSASIGRIAPVTQRLADLIASLKPVRHAGEAPGLLSGETTLAGGPGGPGWTGPTGGRSRQRERSTALAVACRSPDGLVDPEGLTRFVAAMPRLDVSSRAGLPSVLRSFSAEAVGRDNVLLRSVGSGPGRGQSGAFVYFVRGDSDKLVAVTKVFPRVEEMVRELSGLDRLSSPDFVQFSVPEPKRVAIVDLPGGTAGALVMSPAPGRSLFDIIAALPKTGSPDRLESLKELARAVSDSAVALAELHTLPTGSGGPVDPGFLEFNHGLARQEAEALVLHRETLRAAGLNVDKLHQFVEEAIRAARADPGGAGVIHGDAHPGNVFWDATGGVTLIDTPNSHFSMDTNGGPIGSPARDVANMVQRLGRFLKDVGSDAVEVADIQSTFIESYSRSGGPTLPAPALTVFTARLAVHDVLDTSTALTRGDLEPIFERKLRRQLSREIDTLMRALGWEM